MTPQDHKLLPPAVFLSTFYGPLRGRPRPLLVLFFLLHTANEKGLALVTISTMCQTLGLSEESVTTTLKELAKFALIIPRGPATWFIPMRLSLNPTKPTVTPPRGGTASHPQEGIFLAFWRAYPRKVARLAAWKAFLRTGVKGDTLLAGLAWYCRTEWKDRPVDKIPHAATWLNQRRWEDAQETPADGTSRPKEGAKDGPWIWVMGAWRTADEVEFLRPSTPHAKA